MSEVAVSVYNLKLLRFNTQVSIERCNESVHKTFKQK